MLSSSRSTACALSFLMAWALSTSLVPILPEPKVPAAGSPDSWGENLQGGIGGVSVEPAERVLGGSGIMSPPPAAPVNGPFGDWPTFGQNPQRTGNDSLERTLSPSNASELKPIWTTPTVGPVEGSLAVVDGTAYVGVWNSHAPNGTLLTPGVYAINTSSGRVDWTYSIGGGWRPGSPAIPGHGICDQGIPGQVTFPFYGGVSSTGTVWNGTLYIGGGNNTLFALNASPAPTAHRLLWSVDLANSSSGAWQEHYDWGSTLVYNGSVYIGEASGCEGPMRGQLFQVSVATHRVIAIFTAVPYPDFGATIWSTPAVNPETNAVWFTTGNEYEDLGNSSCVGPNTPNSRAIVSVNASNVSQELGHLQVGAMCRDDDFGAGAVLFNSPTGVPMVIAPNKDGIAYAAPQASFVNGSTVPLPSWTVPTANYDVAPVAYDGRDLYLAYGGTGIESLAPGGTARWADPSVSGITGYAEAGLAIANGIVVAALDWDNMTGSSLVVLDSATGAGLFTENFTGQMINGGPVVSDGRIFFGTASTFDTTGDFTGTVRALGIPLRVTVGVDPNASGFVCSSSTNCSKASIEYSATGAGGVPSYNCSWGLPGTSAATGCRSFDAVVPTGASSLTGTVKVRDASGTASPPILATLRTDATPFCLSTSDCGTLDLYAAQTPGVCAPSSMGSGSNGSIACQPEPPDTWSFGATAPTSGGGPFSFQWNFGDGTPTVDSGTARHTFATGGLYRVGVLLEGPGGFGLPDTLEIVASGLNESDLGGLWQNESLGAATPPPPATSGGSLVYDPPDGEFVEFGGCTPTECPSNQTWTYRAGVWTDLTASAGAPPARQGAVLLYGSNALGPSAPGLLLVGGCGTTCPLGDEWSFHAGHWTNVTSLLCPGISGALCPQPSYGSSWAPLSPITSGSVPMDLLFGGCLTNGCAIQSNTTWLLENGSWRTLAPTGPAPVARAEPMMAFDPALGEAALFGGRATGPNGAFLDLNDTWLFDPARSTWSPLPAPPARGPVPGDRTPPARSGGALLAVEGSPALVLSGGLNDSTQSLSTDTWSLACEPTGTASDCAWVPVEGDPGPPARYLAAASPFSGPYPALWLGGGGISGTPLGPGTWALGERVTVEASAFPNPTSVGFPTWFNASVGNATEPLLVDGWAFANGTVPLNQGPPGTSVSERFTSVGTVGARFWAVDSDWVVGSKTTVLTVDPAPSFTIQVAATVGEVGVPFNFTATPPSGGGLAPFRFDWSFGDGAGSTLRNPSHTYGMAGNFTARLNVTDAVGNQAETTDRIDVHPSLEATVAAAPSLLDLGATTVLALSPSGGVPPYTFAWHFGDQTSGNGSPVEHVYESSGSFVATGVLTDAAGAVRTDRVNVTVVPLPAPRIVLGGSASAAPGQSVGMMAQVDGGVPPYEFSWQYGDGVSGKGPAVSHSYAALGSYLVTLTATDSDGGQGQAKVAIFVESAHPSGGSPQGSIPLEGWVVLGTIAGMAAAVVAAWWVVRVRPPRTGSKPLEPPRRETAGRPGPGSPRWGS
ncbi:MAG TPA: PKD domain-containing protein [Thermoplasmata archaeon]|nr:PKD domain-containing protein [Thermoplasmata archaeon]